MKTETETGTPPDEAPTRVILTDSDGYRYDEATGEIVGHVNEAEDRLRILTPEGVNWVLGLLMTQHLRRKSIESERAAVNANLDGMDAEATAKVRWIMRRFGAEVRDQAKRDMAQAGDGKKSHQYPRGKVASRMSAGSASITDPHLATKFVEENAREQLAYKTPSLKAIDAAIAAYVEQIGEEPDTATFLRRAEPRVSWTIETGIGKESLE